MTAARLNTLLLNWVQQDGDFYLDAPSSPGELPNPNVFLSDPIWLAWLAGAVLVIAVLRYLDNRDGS